MVMGDAGVAGHAGGRGLDTTGPGDGQRGGADGPGPLGDRPPASGLPTSPEQVPAGAGICASFRGRLARTEAATWFEQASHLQAGHLGAWHALTVESRARLAVAISASRPVDTLEHVTAIRRGIAEGRVALAPLLARLEGLLSEACRDAVRASTSRPRPPPRGRG